MDDERKAKEEIDVEKRQEAGRLLRLFLDNSLSASKFASAFEEFFN
jgi:hypothetical protein